MKLGPSREEQELLEQVERLVDEVSPLAEANAQKPPAPVDGDTWQKYVDVGWFDADIAESEEGRHAHLFMQQKAGKRLLRGPIAGSVVGAGVLARAGRSDESEAVRDGARRVGLAEPFGDDGTGHVAWDVDDVDAFAIVTPSGTWLVDAADVDVERTPSVEEHRTIGTFELDTDELDATEAGDRAWLQASLLVTGELCGVLEGAMEMSARYAGQRHQFGVPIGTFQAVKHRCADMAVRYELSWALCSLAAVYAADGHPEAEAHVRAAKLLAGESSLTSCRDNVQNHGGFGFTAACDAHHYFKRAMILSRAIGDRAANTHGLAARGYGVARAASDAVVTTTER